MGLSLRSDGGTVFFVEVSVEGSVATTSTSARTSAGVFVSA